MATTTATHPPQQRSRRAAQGLSPQRLIPRVIVYAVTIVFFLFMVLPFLWMVSTSFKEPQAVFAVPPQWIPQQPSLTSFQNLLNEVPFGNFYFNSLKVTVFITVGQLIFCSSAAYAFARLHFPGRDLMFGIFLASLMVPGQVTIIPLYIVIKDLGLLDNHASLILPALTSAFGTFLLRQFFLNIPIELEEAARVDGCGPFRILATIYIPLSGAALATLGIFTFNTFWNEFFRPLIFLNTLGNMTIPVALAFVLGQYGDNQALVMAGVTLAVGPVLLIYLFTQRYMVEGITLSGLKG
jgi:multiple sugar transport system permease protein